MAAMGVTYSWLKRRSARANPVSPGLTATTPTPFSSTMCRAKIFSARVIARLLVLIGGRNTFSRGKLTQRNLFACSNLVDQRKILCGQQPQVLAILFVNSLDVLCNHQLDSSAHFRIGRLFAARALATPFPANRTNKSTPLHVSAPNRQHSATLQPKIGDLSQRLIKVEAVMCGRNFVGRDVIAQLGITGQVPCIPGQVFPRQLPLYELRIFREKQNSPL